MFGFTRLQCMSVIKYHKYYWLLDINQLGFYLAPKKWCVCPNFNPTSPAPSPQLPFSSQLLWSWRTWKSVVDGCWWIFGCSQNQGMNPTSNGPMGSSFHSMEFRCFLLLHNHDESKALNDVDSSLEIIISRICSTSGYILGPTKD